MIDMVKRHEIQVLRRAGHEQAEIARLTGVSVRSIRRVQGELTVSSFDIESERERRRVSRPSKVEPFRPFLVGELAKEPDLMSLELLRRAQAQGYAGGKRALYREKTGHWLRLLGEDFPLAQLSASDVDRYITHRRCEWSVPPRAPVLDQAGTMLKPGRPGRHVTDHTIAKELVALRAALKLAKRRGIWRGDVAEILPVGFAPEYKPRERFLSYDELEALLGELLEDAAARVAFIVATSAEAAATERALREDVSPDRLFVQVRGSKRATRWRKVPIVASWQRDLLDFALEHAQGRDGRLFLPRTKFGQTLERACTRAGIPRCTPNDLRRTYSTWLRADGVPNELSAPTMGHKDTRCSIGCTRDFRRNCFASVCSPPSEGAVPVQ